MKLHEITIRCECKDIQTLIDYLLVNDIPYKEEYVDTKQSDRRNITKLFDHWLGSSDSQSVDSIYRSGGIHVYFIDNKVWGWDTLYHINSKDFQIIDMKYIIRELKLKRVLR